MEPEKKNLGVGAGGLLRKKTNKEKKKTNKRVGSFGIKYMQVILWDFFGAISFLNFNILAEHCESGGGVSGDPPPEYI